MSHPQVPPVEIPPTPLASYGHDKWHQQPVMRLFVGLLAVSVLLSASMLWIAISTDDGLVSDNYYKEGLAISTNIDRDKQAAALGINAKIVMMNDSRMVVHLSATKSTSAALATNFPPILQLRLIHPTQAGKDHRLTLLQQPDGSYLATMDNAIRLKGAAPHWIVQLETANWRLQGNSKLVSNIAIVLTPSYPA